MKRNSSPALTALIMLSLVVVLPLSVLAAEAPASLMVVEWYGDDKVTVNAIPPSDDSSTNPAYTLLPYHWYITANYWINPNNKYGLSTSAVVTAITASANTWDSQTSASVFAYKGTTSKSAGKRDRINVISWGSYQARVIAVTYIWYSGSQILETDMKLNTYYKWSLSGGTGKMDVRNIVTHEFGHWCGLADLYDDKDYWLTMYGYSDFGETYKQTLGLGDISGLQAVYGA